MVGPAGTGKTTALAAAVADLHAQGRPVFGVAPTAKAAQVLGRETGMNADTVAKLLHEWSRPGRPPLARYRLAPGTTLIVDEAGLVGTASLPRLVELAERHGGASSWSATPPSSKRWGGAGCSPSCAPPSPSTNWPASTASPSRGKPPPPPNSAPATPPPSTPTRPTAASTPAPSTTTSPPSPPPGPPCRRRRHGGGHRRHQRPRRPLNHAIQQARLAAGHLDPAPAVAVAGGERAHPGDWVATRRNDRTLTTTGGHAVHNRDLWTVDRMHGDGALTVTHRHGHGTVTLPADYAARHVRLGYAATEHGHQGDTVDVGLTLVTGATTHRGLYVAATRGRHDNRLHVVTDTADPAEARDALEAVLARDRADIPAVTQRRHLARAEGHDGTERIRTRLPDWVEPWRQQLHDRRHLLVDGLHDREQRRADRPSRAPGAPAGHRRGSGGVGAVRPAHPRPRTGAADRAAPGNVERQLRRTEAGFGHRRSAERLAADARAAVENAQAAIAAIHADGAPVKEHLDQLQRRAAELRGRAEPIDGLDISDRGEIRQLDQILDAADTYTGWLEGRPTPTARLAHAVDTLTGVATARALVHAASPVSSTSPSGTSSLSFARRPPART